MFKLSDLFGLRKTKEQTIQTDFIVGKKLMQVVINRYTIDLYFQDVIHIQIGSPIIYSEGRTGIISQWDYINNQPFAINELIDQVAISAEVDEDENLTLEFEDHGRLFIKAKKDIGESYIISHRDDYQVV